MKGILVLYDKQMNEIEKVPLIKAAFKPSIIKKKSIELFNEEEPCIIQETTCINKLGFELLDYINLLEISPEEVFSSKEVNEFTLQIKFPKNVHFFKIE